MFGDIMPTPPRSKLGGKSLQALKQEMHQANLATTFQKKQLSMMLGGTLPIGQGNLIKVGSSINFTPQNNNVKHKLISTEN